MYEYTLLAAQQGEIRQAKEFAKNPEYVQRCDLYIRALAAPSIQESK